MVGEWGTYALTDLYSVSSGLSKPAKDFGEGHPFVSFKDVFYNFFLPDELSQLVRSNEKEQEKCSVRRGDVFLTRTSETMEDLGMSCVSRKDYPSATFNGFCKRLRPSTDLQVHPEYVGYYLRTPQFRNEMLAFSTMSTRASLNNDMIGRLQITLPPLPEQKAIAHVLGSLDDKIELNRRMNETLEGMAQALFKSWFVDFDPVIDNALAAGNPIPEPLAQRAETRRQAIANGTANRDSAQAFPASFRFTEELGWIPEGWDECNLESLATPKKGKNITKKTIIEGKVPVVAGGLQPAYFHNTPNVLGPVITVSASGANAGFVNLYHEDIWASDCSYMSSKETDFVYSTFLFLRSRQDRITHMQQGAAQPHVYPKDLLRLKYANPSKELWSILESIVEASFNKIAENKLESRTLAKLRDVLLPKLISGELRIPQAEKMVEDAIA